MDRAVIPRAIVSFLIVSISLSLLPELASADEGSGLPPALPRLVHAIVQMFNDRYNPRRSRM
jgi:hypothetical protein